LLFKMVLTCAYPGCLMMSRVTFLTWWRNAWRISEIVQDGHFWLKSIIFILIFRKLQIVSLDKTLISQLGLSQAFEAAMRLTFRPSNRLPLKSIIWRKILEFSAQKNLFFFDLRMTWGWVNNQDFFLKVN